jgi:PAS domain S-box-containing protein
MTSHSASQPETLEEALARLAALEQQYADAQRTLVRYQQVIDSLPMRVFWKDRDSRYLGVNQAMLDDMRTRMGGSLDDVVGKTDADLGFPEADIYRADDLRVMNEGDVLREKEDHVVLPDGTSYTTSTTKAPLRGGDGAVDGMIGVFWDVTARKLREEALETMLKYAADILQMNDTLGDSTTYDDLVERLARFTFAADADAVTFFSHVMNEAGVVTDVEIVANLVKPGVPIVVPVGTRYPASQDTLTRLYVDNPTQNVIIEDVQTDERVDPMSRTNFAYLGIVSIVIIPLFRFGRNLGSITLSFYTPRTFSAEEREQLDKLPAILTQIVERLNLLTELRANVNELNAALIFKDQFLAIMSHELRTPLNAILGYATIAQQLGLTQPGSVPEKVNHMMARIIANSDRLLHLINEILDLARINAGRIEIVQDAFDLHETARAWHNDFEKRAAEKGLDFTFSLDESLPRQVIGDHERLTQIIANLLENAVKFTDRGSISLSVQREDAGRLCVRVRDTGIGISPTWHHLIFEEFRRVEMDSVRKTGGAGLGLSIVQRLVKLMGGSVSVESALGAGSTFTIVLPLTPAAESQPAGGAM